MEGKGDRVRKGERKNLEEQHMEAIRSFEIANEPSCCGSA
jgi:hypothetical protein